MVVDYMAGIDQSHTYGCDCMALTRKMKLSFLTWFYKKVWTPLRKHPIGPRVNHKSIPRPRVSGPILDTEKKTPYIFTQIHPPA